MESCFHLTRIEAPNCLSLIFLFALSIFTSNALAMPLPGDGGSAETAVGESTGAAICLARERAYSSN